MSGNLTFNAIDVETANADRASICQIGIVHVREGEIGDEWSTLVDPEDWFDPWNVSIHRIDARAVRTSPTLPHLRDELRRRLRGSVLVSHTAFDRTAFERAMNRYGLEQLQVTWLDSSRVVRRAWPDRYASGGWGLESVARDLGIVFTHHDALQDARAAATILCRAAAETSLDIQQWLERVQQPMSPWATAGRCSGSGSSPPCDQTRRPSLFVNVKGNPDGHLFGETVAFTGALSVPRQQAAAWALEAGCTVGGNVTGKTTMLIVGLQDRARLRGYDKSSKHRKAEVLIQAGQGLQILSEDDFTEMLRLAENDGRRTRHERW